jgi:hypothetical protein
MHKFGIELPKTVAEALKIDERTGTDFMRKAIEQEMKNVMPAFEFIDGDNVTKFYKKIDCHMIFDVKMNLTRKARLVAGGHQTDPPKESTYSSVVSGNSIRIAFTFAALNDLDVLSANVQVPECSYKGEGLHNCRVGVWSAQSWPSSTYKELNQAQIDIENKHNAIAYH